MLYVSLMDTSELLSLPIVDLLEKDVGEFEQVLEGELPNDEVLGAIDYFLRLKVVQFLAKTPDLAALELESAGYRCLVPPHRVDALEAGGSRWATRWQTLAGVLEAAVELKDSRRRPTDRKLAHVDRIVNVLKISPRITQVRLAQRLELNVANLSRILALMELDGIIVRHAVGREKELSLVRPEGSARSPDLNEAGSDETGVISTSFAWETANFFFRQSVSREQVSQTQH